MKRFNFLLVAIAIVLTVTAVSCTTMAGTQDDDYYYSGRDAQVYGNRVYVDDPYRGTVVLERDPRTGRYYEVSSPYYDGYYGNRRVYSSRAYGNTYGRSPYYGRSNGGYYRNNDRSYSTNNSGSQNNQRSTEEYKKDRDDARKKVLGN